MVDGQFLAATGVIVGFVAWLVCWYVDVAGRRPTVALFVRLLCWFVSWPESESVFSLSCVLLRLLHGKCDWVEVAEALARSVASWAHIVDLSDCQAAVPACAAPVPVTGNVDKPEADLEAQSEQPEAQALATRVGIRRAGDAPQAALPLTDALPSPPAEP